LLLAVLPPPVAIEIRRWRHKRFALLLLLLAPFSAAAAAAAISISDCWGADADYLYISEEEFG
jgi:hypothetical protein